MRRKEYQEHNGWRIETVGKNICCTKTYAGAVDDVKLRKKMLKVLPNPSIVVCDSYNKKCHVQALWKKDERTEEILNKLDEQARNTEQVVQRRSRTKKRQALQKYKLGGGDIDSLCRPM